MRVESTVLLHTSGQHRHSLYAYMLWERILLLDTTPPVVHTLLRCYAYRESTVLLHTSGQHRHSLYAYVLWERMLLLDTTYYYRHVLLIHMCSRQSTVLLPSYYSVLVVV